MAKAKRGYSREFKPRAGATRVKFEIDKVPPTLAKAVRARLKREGKSLRALVLSFLTAWVHQPEPPTET